MNFGFLEGKSDKIIDLTMEYAPKMLLATITLFVGLWIIKVITKTLARIMEKRNFDKALKPFFIDIIAIFLKVLLVISVAGMLGIEMTSFIAILGAAGLAIGMALSGTLQNFAGGIIILLFKPFRIDDCIEAQSYIGIVKEIQLFNTILLTFDNKTVIIPNGVLSTQSLINYSTQLTRRVDMTFGIGYNDDIDQAREILNTLLSNHPKVLKDPVHFIAVSELADSSVNFVVRAWVNSADYWDVFFFMQEAVKKEFDKKNIGIPFPQRDVHVYNH